MDESLLAARNTWRAHWYARGWFTGDTVADRIIRAVHDHQSSEIQFESKARDPVVCSPRQLLDDGMRVAAALRQLGTGPGDVVAIQLPAWAEGSTAYIATLAAGAIVLPLPHSYGPSELGAIIRDARAKVLFMPDKWRSINYLDRLDRAGLESGQVRTIVVGDDIPSWCTSWDEMLSGTALSSPAAGVSPDDVCLLGYTSGTSGRPKGVMHSHSSLLAELDQLPYYDGDNYDHPYLEQYPAGHMAGTIGMLRPILHAVDTIFMDAWDACTAATLIDQRGVGATSGTPLFLEGLLDDAEAHGHPLAGLRSYVIGAAIVPPGLVRRADEAGIPVVRCYGLSEQLTITSGRVTESLEVRSTTDGLPLPGRLVRVVDENGVDVPAGTDGDILVAGPEQFVGYWDPADESEAFDHEGWFRTGDVGRLTGGRLAITDRKKDLIVRGGENISSREVEEILLSFSGVADVAVVSAPDERYGESICAFLVMADGKDAPDPPQLREFFEKAGVSRHKVPQQVVAVSDLPRAPTGKILKGELRARIRGVSKDSRSSRSTQI